MKRLITGITLMIIGAVAVGATMQSMSKAEIQKVFVGKTFVSIGTDNLNGQTIDNTFSMFFDGKGHIFGKMAVKPAGEPQTDEGSYSFGKDGAFYITWQHWDGGKKLCGHVFETKNAYISVGCDDVFHTVFMKQSVQVGNQLQGK